MRPLVLLTAAVVAIAGAPASADAASLSCGSIGWTPNSDDGAFDIRARDVGCRKARRVARAAKPYGPSGEPGTTFRYRARGFRCVGTERDTALPSIRFSCRRDSARVTFSRT